MTSEAIKKAHTNPYQVIPPKKEENTSKADNVSNSDPYFGDSYVPRFKASEAQTIPYDQAGNVRDFKKLGQEIFTHNEHKGDRRVQYALRYYAKYYGGLDIGNTGKDGWGGDGVLGTKCEKAIAFIMQTNGIKSRSQAIAWVMDKTKGEIGLGIAKPYYNLHTGGFDAGEPAWAKRPKSNDPTVQMMWETPIAAQYEDERKYGPKRATLEKFWAKSVEPILRKAGRSDELIKSEKRKFFAVGDPYVKAENHDGELKGARAIESFRENTINQERILKTGITAQSSDSERNLWLNAQWDREIEPALVAHGIHSVAIDAIKKNYIKDWGTDLLEAKNDQDFNRAKNIFDQEKQRYVLWNPNGRAEVA